MRMANKISKVFNIFIIFEYKYLAMKQFSFVIILGSLLLVACSKGGSTTSTTNNNTTTPTTPAAETKIAVSFDVDKGDGSIFGALGATQVVNIAVTDLPKAGVQVEAVTKRDLDSVVVSTASIAGMSSPIPVTIDNLKSGVVCTVSITVTSKSTASNAVTKSFKIARK
jgi:hypothetical protein